MGNIIIEYLGLITMSMNDLVSVRVERDILAHSKKSKLHSGPMGLLPYTQNHGLHMRRECRERFPRPRGSWWRGKIPGIPGARETTILRIC